ncbi:MAG TPA: putative lipid II flippase FtsW [Thermoleophilaceae bacterium]|nr:putative lipid II flippase FtsW [Thermoleophilaceae bacterium]
MAAAKGSRRRAKPPLEYSILYTATLCLLAAGAVMVYSASSAESLTQNGDPAFFLKRYVVFGALGVVAMHLLSRRGLELVRRATPLLLGAAFCLTLAVMLPGIGITVNGATRWLGAGPVQFQPSELLKIALVLYAANLIASRPRTLHSVRNICRPLLMVVGAACALLLKQPDMGTAMVICFATFALLVAAGAKMRHLGTIFLVLGLLAMVFALAEPYRRDRVLSFVNPWNDAAGTGFQAAQAQIALGSGGLFGVGLGESVQKNFYLPEAHTDMILAIVGEELGVLGVAALAALYGLIAYAGFRTAKLARDKYAKLLAAGLTALILTQAALNFFAVLGMAPLTGVPLPFVSYGSSNLVVLLAAMGLVLNVAATGGRSAAKRPRRRLEAIDGGSDADSDRRRGDRGARRARAGDRRRAAG